MSADLSTMIFDPNAFLAAGDSPYAEFGPRFVEAGYVALPCRPGSKVPGTYRSFWFNALEWAEKWAHRLPTEDEIGLWSVWPDAPGINVVCGRQGGNLDALVAFDIDTDEPGLFQALQSVMPDSPVGKIGRRGETLFARVPAGVDLPSRGFSINKIRVLDVLGHGRQTVVPPTIHPDLDRPYRWSRGPALYEVPLSDLPAVGPEIYEAIEGVLKDFGWTPRPERAEIEDRIRAPREGNTPHRDLNEHALATLDAWVPHLGLYDEKRTRQGYAAVPYWRPNGKGLRLEERQRSLSIHPDGIRDMSADIGHTPLDLVMLAQGCDLGTAFAFLARRTGWMGDVPDMPIPTFTPVQVREVPVSAPPEIMTEPTPVPDVPPDDLTRVPGLIGRIVDWMEAAAESPTRELSLGAAIAVVGTLIGRRYRGPTRSGTHLYIVLAGPTACGKDWPQKAAAALLTAAGAECHVGPDDYMSLSGAISATLDAPLHLAIIDEVGAAIRRINSARASEHVMLLTKFIRTAWGTSGDPMKSPAWAGRKSITIQAPCISILGGSTIEELMDAFSEQSATNGMLNRFTFFSLRDYPPDATPTVTRDVPESLAQELRDLYHSHGQPAVHMLNQADMIPAYQEVPFADDAARDAYQALKLKCRDLMRMEREMAAFLGRTSEMALRIATIRAVSLDPARPGITVDDMRWGEAVALKSARVVHREAGDHLGATETSKLALKIIDLVKANPDGITHRDLHRKVGQKWPSRQFSEVVNALVVDSERIVRGTVVSQTNLRTSVVYTLNTEA